MTSAQLGDARQVVTLWVALNEDGELTVALHCRPLGAQSITRPSPASLRLGGGGRAERGDVAGLGFGEAEGDAAVLLIRPFFRRHRLAPPLSHDGVAQRAAQLLALLRGAAHPG